jgi:hypothetical protein
MPIDLAAAALGWLVQVFGDTGIALVRGPQDERKLKKAVEQAIKMVVDRAEPGSQEALRQGLELCFSSPRQIRVEGSSSVGEGLRTAIAAQVKQLAEWVNTNTGRPFYSDVWVGPDWVTEQVTDAFVTALRHFAAGGGLAELVHGLDTADIMARLDSLDLQISGLTVAAPTAPQPGEGAAASKAVSADAILRGPIAHLELAQRLRDADDARDTDPAAAAAGYGVIADALTASPYVPHAAWLRSRQADALLAAGDVTAAIEAELTVMAAALSSGD